MDALLNKMRALWQAVENGQRDTVTEAVNALKNLSREVVELRDTKPLPEAPASATAKVVDPTSQLEWLVTVRQPGQGIALIQVLPEVGKVLLDNGFIAFDAYVDKRRAERETSRTNGSQGGAALPPPVTANQPQAQQDEFPAATLVISINKGKPYYKVQGGKFTQYGVTIWPEVLQAAGYDVNALDPMQTYNLAGYTAVYVCKDDGKPDKVVELRRD